LDLAYRGAHLILACRDSKKAEIAAKEIIKLTNNKNVDVEFLDLSDLNTIRSFAEKMNKNLSRLDILVNNAGNFFYSSYCLLYSHVLNKVP
jgi:NAD(P)-dependent dehydrogenase (short-subunit alcohol dehydrogenase family)